MAGPEVLTNKRLWLRAKDVAGGDGDPVTAWADQSGLGNNPTIMTTVNKLLAATPAGGPAISIVGVGNVSFGPLWPKRDDIVITRSSQFNAGYEPYHTIDGLYGNGSQFGWVSSAAPSVVAPQWIAFEFDSPFVLTEYTIHPNSTNRAPKDFVMQGSLDGVTWDDLDTRVGVAWATTTGQTFSFASSTAYGHYRLHCTATQATDLLHLLEVEFNGETNGYPYSTGEIWMVLKSRAAVGGSTGSFYFGASSGQSHYPYDDGNIYTQGISSQRPAFTPPLEIRDWRLLRIVQYANAMRLYVDGISAGIVLNAPARWGVEPRLAASFAADFAEVLLVAGAVPDPAELTVYFNTEHGTTAIVPPTLDAHGQEVMADLPVLYAKLDEASGTVVEDITGLQDGTYVGAPTLGAPSLLPSGFGSAVALNGTSQRVTFPSAPAYNIQSAVAPFGLKCFVKLTAPELATLQVLADKTNLSEANNQWCLYWDNRNLTVPPNTLALRYNGGGTLSTSLSQWSGTDVRDKLAAGGHLIITLSPTTITWYWDGVEVYSSPRGSGAITSGGTQILSLGATSAGSFWMDGMLDEFALYQSEITPERVAAQQTAAGATGPVGGGGGEEPVTPVGSSASSTLPGTSVSNLFDEGEAYWEAATTEPVTVQTSLPASAKVKSHEVKARPDKPQAAPAIFSFEGSNDGTSWTVLDTKTGQVYTAGEIKKYTINSDTPYQHYRLVITASGETGVYTSFEEWKIYREVPATPGEGEPPVAETFSYPVHLAGILYDVGSTLPLFGWRLREWLEDRGYILPPGPLVVKRRFSHAGVIYEPGQPAPEVTGRERKKLLDHRYIGL